MVTYQELISDEISRRKKNNHNYSQRAFARDVGISPSYLTQVLNSKRKLSIERAYELATTIGWTSAKINQFIGLLESSKTTKLSLKEAILKNRSTENIEYSEINCRDFSLVSNWIYFAMMEVISIQGLSHEVRAIARKLRVNVIEAENALKVLNATGLIRKCNITQRYEKTFKCYTSSRPDNVRAKAETQPDHLKHHLDQLSRLSSRIRTLEPEKVKLENVTVGISTEKLSVFKSKLVDFAKTLHSEMLTDSPDEVYQLSMYLFPQT